MVGIIDSWPSAIVVSVIGAVILAISYAIIAFVGEYLLKLLRYLYTEHPKILLALFVILICCGIALYFILK